MPQRPTVNNKRIAKNTLMLYFRMIVVTILSFITIKYTLNILGEDDFGIYNLVAGVVTFLTFVTATIASATQRYLAFEIGRGNARRYNDTFNMLLLLFVGLGILLFGVFEALAHPLIFEWLNIPDARRDTALVVYHVSILAFITSVAAIPFISSILANEKMGVYAYITIADTVAKLFLLAILFFSPFDKLLSYAAGTLFIAICTNSIYYIYNQKKIANTQLYYYWEPGLFCNLMKYIGWSFFGSISAVMCNQGLSILMNVFFGVQVNAAKGISDRVKTIIQSFVTNFYMAVNPQITKTYAAGDYKDTIKLAFSSTRLSYYLMLILCVPIILLLEDLLRLWLGSGYSPDMLVFTQLSIIFILVNVFEAPITFMVRATGDIKRYQICVGTLTLFTMPLACLLYLLGCPAYAAFWCEIVIYAMVQLIRVAIAKRYYPITIVQYCKEVLVAPLAITATVALFSFALSCMQLNIVPLTILTFSLLMVLIWTIGLRENEKELVKKKVYALLCAIKNYTHNKK